MQRIQIEITARRPRVLGSPVLVCNNTGDKIAFTFDDEWTDAKEKTARFVYNKDGKAVHTDVPLSAKNEAEIPPLSNTRDVRVGVYAGALATTTAARIPCEPSILCNSGDEQVDFYALGRDAEHSQFWDALQQNGKRTVYPEGFFGSETTDEAYQVWTDEMFNPKYDIILTTGPNLFSRNQKLTRIPVRCISKSGTNPWGAFFYLCHNLRTIKGLKVRSSDGFYNTFTECYALEDIEFEGTIGQDISLQWSENLNDKSLVSLVLALKNYDGTNEANTKTVYLPDNIKERLFEVFVDESILGEAAFDSEYYGFSLEDVLLCKAWNY